MKLILKRCGEKPKGIDGRPWALHSEDGQLLPCQVSVTLHSTADECPKVAVVFQAIGGDFVIEGDDK